MNNDFANYFEVDESLFDGFDIEIHENTGSSGEMTYNYYFYVPDDSPEELLKELNWSVGQVIELPLNWDQ